MSRRPGFTVLAASLTPALSQRSRTAQSAANQVCAGPTATVVGDADVPEVIGTSGRDIIVGSGHNHLQGLGGDDTIEVSGRGFGGRGNDTFGGEYTDDRLVGGRDTAGGKAGLDTCLAESTVNCDNSVS